MAEYLKNIEYRQAHYPVSLFLAAKGLWIMPILTRRESEFRQSFKRSPHGVPSISSLHMNSFDCYDSVVKICARKVSPKDG